MALHPTLERRRRTSEGRKLDKRNSKKDWTKMSEPREAFMNDHCGRICSSPVLLAAFAVLILAGPAYGQGKAPDFSGTYWASQYNAKGKEAYEKNMAGLKDGSITDDARKYCTPDGPLRNLATPYPFEIFQAPPGQVTIIHELNHQIRVVTLDKPLPKYEELVPYPYYNGHAYGSFEGDTLVVQVAGFNEKTFLDATGAPHTDELVTTERFRKISPTQLEVVVNIHDPDYYTRDWQARFVYTLRNDVR